MQRRVDHIRSLARQLGVRVWICDTCEDDWGAAVEFEATEFGLGPAVYLGQSPDSTCRAYWTALHELGHHADPEGFGGLRLDREAFAWRWALEHAAYPARMWVWADIYRALSSYGEDRRMKQTPAYLDLLHEAERRMSGSPG